MQLDAALLTHQLDNIPALARAAEAAGFAGLWTAETAHEPFLPLTLAAEHTSRLSLGTAIATAFTRSPTTLAHTAWDLARYSRGRFILGLGTQVKAHNERRFGVAWEQPAARLREVILAIRALWDCWQHGAKLNFRGEFFKLTLMTDFFNPGPHYYPDIPIFIAGVNPRMCHLAGELCDGLHVHPLHSPRYLAEAIWPNVERGLTAANRRREDIALHSTILVIPTDDPHAASIEADVRRQIAFYASTPSYRAVLALHGWQATGAELSALAAKKRWSEMPALVTDEMLDAFAARAPWADLPATLRARYSGGLLQRVSYYLPFTPGQRDEQWQATIAGFKA